MFYLGLPSACKRADVGIIGSNELKGMLARRGLLFHKIGCFYDVRKHGKVIVKTSVDNRALIDEHYLGTQLRSVVEQELSERPLLDERGARVGRLITEAYMRARIDLLNYRDICREVPHANLIDQSVFVLWEADKRGVATAHEVLLQPYVFGVDFGVMIASAATFNGVNRLNRSFEKFIPQLGPQMRQFLGSGSVDFFPNNFIFTRDLKLVYIDYQPILNKENADYNANCMDQMVSSWGF